MSNYEVELKYANADHARLRIELKAMGGLRAAMKEQVDEYWRHPVRDFERTGEAFRIRVCNRQTLITYKGPKQEGVAKNRLEIELPFAASVGTSELQMLLRQLGFQSVATVRKQRETWRLDFENRKILAVLDQVEHVGDFIELETQSPQGDIRGAESTILNLAKRLGLKEPSPDSYLALLLGRQDG